MAGNWTPGPWTVKWSGRSARREILARGSHIASVVGSTNGTAPDDAHLISAAPELYRALDAAIITLRARDQSEIEAAVVAAGKFALAKARGDQPDSDPPIPTSATSGA